MTNSGGWGGGGSQVDAGQRISLSPGLAAAGNLSKARLASRPLPAWSTRLYIAGMSYMLLAVESVPSSNIASRDSRDDLRLSSFPLAGLRTYPR